MYWDYYFDLNDRTIFKKEKKVKLTEKELQLILYLDFKKVPQNIIKLQNEIWGYNKELETHTVETHIYRLRKKIQKEFNDEQFIKSNKKGYSLWLRNFLNFNVKTYDYSILSG